MDHLNAVQHTLLVIWAWPIAPAALIVAIGVWLVQESALAAMVMLLGMLMVPVAVLYPVPALGILGAAALLFGLLARIRYRRY